MLWRQQDLGPKAEPPLFAHIIDHPVPSPIRTPRCPEDAAGATLNNGEVTCPAGSVRCVKKKGAAEAEGNSSNYKTNYQMLMMPIGFA